MLFKTYKGCIIEGVDEKSKCIVSYYETPFSKPVKWEAKSLRVAKVSITKFMTMQTVNKYLERV